MFNYTAFLETAPSLANRVMGISPPPGVGLPLAEASFPVPINMMEGERLYPVTLGFRDIALPDGTDLLRLLSAYLPSLQSDELPFVLSQIASTFVVLVRDQEMMRRLKGAEFIHVHESWALIAPAPGTAIAYGVDLNMLVKEQVGKFSPSMVITHPDESIEIGLMPLNRIPTPRKCSFRIKYVLGSSHQLVPATQAEETPTWETAYFSTFKLAAHAMSWSTVERRRRLAPVIRVVKPGVLCVYHENSVGYLQEDVLTRAPNPWAGPKPVVPEMPVPSPIPQETPAPVATGDAVTT
jgi:hypothetical protein